jgi:hypothetical protein
MNFLKNNKFLIFVITIFILFLSSMSFYILSTNVETSGLDLIITLISLVFPLISLLSLYVQTQLYIFIINVSLHFFAMLKKAFDYNKQPILIVLMFNSMLSVVMSFFSLPSYMIQLVNFIFPLFLFYVFFRKDNIIIRNTLGILTILGYILTLVING